MVLRSNPLHSLEIRVISMELEIMKPGYRLILKARPFYGNNYIDINVGIGSIRLDFIDSLRVGTVLLFLIIR